MLSDHDRVVLDEIERELGQADPDLAAEFTQWRAHDRARPVRGYIALLLTGALVAVLGGLVLLPVMYWTGVFIVATTIGTRRWWPRRRHRT